MLLSFGEEQNLPFYEILTKIWAKWFDVGKILCSGSTLNLKNAIITSDNLQGSSYSAKSSHRKIGHNAAARQRREIYFLQCIEKPVDCVVRLHTMATVRSYGYLRWRTYCQVAD